MDTAPVLCAASAATTHSTPKVSYSNTTRKKWNKPHPLSIDLQKHTLTHFQKKEKNWKGRHKQSHYIYIFLHHCTKRGRVGRRGGEGRWRDGTITSLTTAWMHQTGNYEKQTRPTTRWEQEDPIHMFAANKIQVCHVSADESDGAFMVLVVSKSTWFGIPFITNKDQHNMHRVNI